MVLLLDETVDMTVVHRSPTGAVRAELPGGLRLTTYDLVPVPAPGETDAWFQALARTHLPDADALSPVTFTSSLGWPLDAVEARAGDRVVTLIVYRFWSYAGVVVVTGGLDALTTQARAILASGRPRWDGATRCIAELWS